MSKSKNAPVRFEASLVLAHGERPYTTSLLIAEKFGRNHRNVLRDIRKLVETDEISRLNIEPRDFTRKHLFDDISREFVETTYVDERGKAQPMYELGEEGYAILAMGFTGPEALQWKRSFYRAFRWMEGELSRVRLQKQNLEWQQQRAIGKGVRYELTDAIKLFVAYAVAMGSKNADKYYKIFTDLIQRAMFITEDGEYADLRDRLSDVQLTMLATCERMGAKALMEAVAAELPYKGAGGCYEYVRDRVAQFVDLVGRASVPAPQLSLIGADVKSLSEAA